MNRKASKEQEKVKRNASKRDASASVGRDTTKVFDFCKVNLATPKGRNQTSLPWCGLLGDRIIVTAPCPPPQVISFHQV